MGSGNFENAGIVKLIIMGMVSIAIIMWLTNLSYEASSIQIFNTQNRKDTLISQWRNDSLGCRGERSFKTADLLFEKYKLQSKSINEVKQILGKPNKEIQFGEKWVVLRYYYHACCRDGKQDFNCDYSWVDFTFKNSEVALCEISGGVM